MRTVILTIMMGAWAIGAAAQTDGGGQTTAEGSRNLLGGAAYRIETQATAAHGSTPLWLNANRYGLSSIDDGNGYLRVGMEKGVRSYELGVRSEELGVRSYEEEADGGDDAPRRWEVGYGLDVAVASGFTSRFIVQQAYGELRWLNGTLTVGSRQWPMQLKNQRLSSGSQTLGINARPVPQVRIALPHYYTLPLAHGWLQLKGHIAYGMMTDDGWQHRFTGRQEKYADHVMYHSKAGYLRIGNREVFCPWSLELGLEMAAQFGGTAHVPNDDGQMEERTGERGWRALWHAFVPGGADAGEDTYRNVAGNQVGSWLLRANYDGDDFGMSLYADKYFEDHSGMFLIDYDGYGEGDEWQTKKQRRALIYDPKDWMLGMEMDFKQGRWADQLVVEYLYSKYQSGPIYHDHTRGVADHIGGKDNYYDHYIYPGWQHWGQVMGNPLYRSPIYNTNGRIEVADSRFMAFHAGLSGRPWPGLRYRLLATWQEGLGTYDRPYDRKRHNVSLMGEVAYSIHEGWFRGFTFKGAAGMDAGSILGHNYGLQLTITKTGKL